MGFSGLTRGVKCVEWRAMPFPFPDSVELLEAMPIIFSLIIIEGLLSVDNALAIAAMASHLPEKKRLQALRYGIIGAYLFRGICMACAALIIENPWLKICGAAYLVYLMCHHFTSRDGNADGESQDSGKARGFVATIVAIEVMDLSLSVDNVVAAVAMSPKLWIVCTGVFIGILALRFVAGACLRLIEKFPILKDTAFLLIGYVGFILVYELLSDPHSGMQVFPGPVHVTALQKFIGIVLIIGLSLVYDRIGAIRAALKPVLPVLNFPMAAVSFTVGGVLKVISLPFKLAIRAFRRDVEA